MKFQKLLSYTRRAIDDFKMIEDGDRIAVGISGGKDSLALLLALKGLQRFYPKRFEVCGITISLGLPNSDYSKVTELCIEHDIPYYIVHTDIGQIVFEERKEKNPCSLCSKMRKGSLHDKALELNCNKIALGHNKNDVNETLLMSLFLEGRIHTFAPVSYLSRKNLHNIRPLMYVPEKEIISFIKKYDINIVKSPCQVDGKTKREDIKKLIASLSKDYIDLDNKVFGAILRSDIEGYSNLPRA